MWRSIALIMLCMIVAGCGRENIKPPKAPDIVRVPVTVIVGVPDELTRLMDVGEPRENSYDEAKRLALFRRETMEDGNCRFLRIIKLGRALGTLEQTAWENLKCDNRKVK